MKTPDVEREEIEQTINFNLPFLKHLDTVSRSVLSDSLWPHGL